MMSRRAFLIASAVAPAAFAPWPATAAKPEIHTGAFDDLAVGGFDAVAYFTEGRPVEGRREFTHRWRGAAWRLASAGNRDAFAAEPERYAPRFGGHCAWATARGNLAPGRPQHWRIVDGRLYLNYDAKVQERWLADVPGFIAKADANWPAVLGR